MRRLLVPAVLLLLTALRPLPARGAPTPLAPFQKGIALGLFSEDPGWSYRPLLDEIAASGADHVELVVAWYLADVHAADVHDHPRFTAPEEALVRAIRDAHAAGLRVLLFPILRLERQDHPNEWRGTLSPRDRSALLGSYTRKLLGLARLAAREKVEVLSVGSELSTLDTDRVAWSRIVAAVRSLYPGGVTYSGNWDHYRSVAFYDLLDYAGLCGYFALASSPGAPVEALAASWRGLREELLAFGREVGRPILFTEVGYLSQRGAAAWPWNEGASEPIDLEDQRRCYEAFRRAWQEAPFAGVYFWNWYGWGGERSPGYTPRGKPALSEIRAFFRGRPTLSGRR